MNILVISASKHGSTRGIAEAIADELRQRSISVDERTIAEVTELKPYDGIVFGSGVYMGKWLPEALEFLEMNQRELFEKPLWLFSSGPLGDPPRGSMEEHEVLKLVTETAAIDHQIFTGSLDTDDLGLREKLVVKVVHAPAGDFRDWEAIRAWANTIAATLPAHLPAHIG